MRKKICMCRCCWKNGQLVSYFFNTYFKVTLANCLNIEKCWWKIKLVCFPSWHFRVSIFWHILVLLMKILIVQLWKLWELVYNLKNSQNCKNIIPIWPWLIKKPMESIWMTQLLWNQWNRNFTVKRTNFARLQGLWFNVSKMSIKDHVKQNKI